MRRFLSVLYKLQLGVSEGLKKHSGSSCEAVSGDANRGAVKSAILFFSCNLNHFSV